MPRKKPTTELRLLAVACTEVDPRRAHRTIYYTWARDEDAALMRVQQAHQSGDHRLVRKTMDTDIGPHFAGDPGWTVTELLHPVVKEDPRALRLLDAVIAEERVAETAA